MPVSNLRPLPPEQAQHFELVVDICVREFGTGRVVGFRRVEAPLVSLAVHGPWLLEKVGRAIDMMLGREVPATVDPRGYLENFGRQT